MNNRVRDPLLKCLVILFLVIVPCWYNAFVSFFVVGPNPLLALNVYSILSFLVTGFQFSFPILALLYFSKESYKEYGFKKTTLKELCVSLLRITGCLALFAVLVGIMAGILALVDMLLLNKGIADEMLGQEIKLKHNSIIMISLQLIPMAIAAFAEELCFRSYLYKNLNKLIGNKLLCIIIINIAFALCHIYQGIIGVISAFILGMALSLEFKKRGSIFTISLFHLLRNIISII